MATSTQTLAAAVVARLEGALPARLTAAGLPALTELLAYQPALPNPSHAPQLWVAVSQVRAAGPGAFGATNAMSTRTRVLQVGITAAGADAALAESRLLGYVDLLIEVLTGDRTALWSAHNLRFLRADFSANLAGTATSLFREAVLTIEADRWSADGED